MDIVGIIPARRGSRRLPNKNLAELAGQPLLSYTCHAALESGVFSAVYVNTDSDEIADVARRHGVPCPALRPPGLAGDGTTMRDANPWLLQTLARRGESFDALMILQPTSPLRTPSDIRGAAQLFEEHAPCTVMSVTPLAPANWLARIDHAGRLERLPGDERMYRLNGAIYIHMTQDYLADHAPRKTMAYVMPPERSVDIDTLDDLRLAELLLGDCVMH